MPMRDAKRTDVPVGGNDSAPFDPASSCKLLLACVRIVRIVDDATGTYARTHAGATDTGADADTCVPTPTPAPPVTRPAWLTPTPTLAGP